MSEFEAWYLIEMVACCGKSIRGKAEENIAWRRDDGSYADPMLRLASLAWQASRAALVIDLPKSCSKKNTEIVKAVGRHILLQGIKVKP